MSVVSGAYFLAGPLLFGDLFGGTSSPMFVRMFLENLEKLRIRIFVFLLNFSCFVTYYEKDLKKTKQRREGIKIAETGNFEIGYFCTRINETQISEDKKVVFFETSWTVVYATVEIL